MRFTTLNGIQLFALAILIALLSTTLTCINTWYLDQRLLPMVYRDAGGVCMKVENFENGHAFNCNDVDVILRRYKTSK